MSKGGSVTWGLVVAAAIWISSPAEAQITFDVKTQLEEKAQLTVVKAGVISALEQASWARVEEFGEDYSLWITGTKYNLMEDSTEVMVGLNLRTPAALSRGDHVATMIARVTYDSKTLERRASPDSSGNASRSAPLSDNQSQATDAAAQALSQLAIQAVGDVTVPGLGTIVSLATRSLSDEFERQPSAKERAQAALVGAAARDTLRGFFAEQSQSQPRR